MPDKMRPGPAEIDKISAASPESGNADWRNARSAVQARLFGARKDVEGYREWQTDVPESLRRVVEGHLLGIPARRDTSATPLVGQFLHGFRELLRNPEFDLNGFPADARVKKQLTRLQGFVIGGEKKVNIFSRLNDPAASFAMIADDIKRAVVNRLEWIARREEEELEEYKKEELDLKPSSEPDEYTPHRAPQEKREGEPTEAVALVFPFYGGYYKDGVFDEFDTGTLTWKKSERVLRAFSEQRVDAKRKRVYKASASARTDTVIKLPYGWGIDQASLKWEGGRHPEKTQLLADQNGIVYLRTEAKDEVEFTFQIEIGPTDDILPRAESAERTHGADDKFSAELEVKATEIMADTGSDIQKARRITSFIRGHLEYDMDMAWEAVYKADPSAYFEKIWEHKKAKCDEANTLAARLLSKLGFHARFISGHSVRAKSEKGEAMLADGNRHAWIEVFDPDAKKWARLDATPKGDPNVDEEEQKDDLGEGDYGEQEAELLSEEEMQKQLERLIEQEKEQASPEIVFAEQAGCAPEEAKRVLDTIKRLREQYRKVLEDARQYWRQVVRKNLKEEIAYVGPVPQSRGDELDDVVEARIDLRAKERDPSGWKRTVRETKEEKLFGGYEVYIAADMSDSMNEQVVGAKKSEVQRDMVFLLTDSIMGSAVSVRQFERKLKVPMPVRVCVTVFGAKTELILPLTDKWGPAEQVRLYRSLDAGAGGGTPDDHALTMIERQIDESVESEELARAKMKNRRDRAKWKTRRFIIAVADGGSNDPGAVKEANDRLKTKNIPVDLFLIAPEEDKNLLALVKDTYQSVTQTPDPTALAEKGLANLVMRLKESYGVG